MSVLVVVAAAEVTALVVGAAVLVAVSDKQFGEHEYDCARTSTTENVAWFVCTL